MPLSIKRTRALVDVAMGCVPADLVSLLLFTKLAGGWRNGSDSGSPNGELMTANDGLSCSCLWNESC